MSAPHHSDEVVWDIGWDEMDAAEARPPASPTLHPEHQRLISLCAELAEESNALAKWAEQLEAALEDFRRLHHDTTASLEDKLRLAEQERAASQESLTAQLQREEMLTRQRDAAEAALRDAGYELEKLKEEIAKERLRSQLASGQDQERKTLVSQLTQELSKTKSAFGNMLASGLQGRKKGEDEFPGESAPDAAELPEGSSPLHSTGQAPAQEPAAPTATPEQEGKSASLWSNATKFFETRRTAARSLLPEGSIFFQDEPEATELPRTTESEKAAPATPLKKSTPTRRKQDLVGPAFGGALPESSGQPDRPRA